MSKRRLLWCGDAVVASGFARCTHYTLEVLRRTWDVHVLGLNYLGDPHSYPYPIYPCFPGGDAFGVGRIKALVDMIKPELVVLQNDPWNIPAYTREIDGAVPVVAAVAVDGKNCRGRGLNSLKAAIFWTQFGMDEAVAGGYKGLAGVVPLGVDLKIYRPFKRITARERVGLPEKLRNAFIVGNVNRNQPRKRLDLTIKYFAEWVKRFNIEDAYLFLHVAPTGDAGYDVQQLMRYYGVPGRLILAEPEIRSAASEEMLALTYATFDVMLTTTQGEGWGLTTMEGMACGIPQVVPDWAALGEWCGDAVIKVPCTTTACTPNNINVIGGVADQEAVVQALQDLYSSVNRRNELQAQGLRVVRQDKYRWENIGERFAQVLEEAMQQ